MNHIQTIRAALTDAAVIMRTHGHDLRAEDMREALSALSRLSDSIKSQDERVKELEEALRGMVRIVQAVSLHTRLGASQLARLKNAGELLKARDKGAV